MPAAAAILGTGGDDNRDKIASPVNIRAGAHPVGGRRLDISVRRRNNVEQ